MLEFLVGKKGTGKTKYLVAGVNKASEEAKGNVVFITDDAKRHMYDIKPIIRLVDSAEFGMKSFEELTGFIEGIISGNFDITNIFVDAIFKIIGKQELDGIEYFVERLENVSNKYGVDFVISYSMDAETAPECIKRYLKQI